MIYGEKSSHHALIVDNGGSADKLKRIPFMSNEFNEAWLQKLLEENPSIIPSFEFGRDFSPLICIGREVPVGSGENQGYIDNLYLSPTGAIVIVETKLFRNQEARRTVVAQIIDYAKEVQKWDAEKIESIASDYYYRKTGQAFRLIDIMVRNGFLSFADEGKLIDNINKNLENASFLLMVIGDGIRSGVQQLADFLNDNTAMSFQLALAEMEIYKYCGGLIIIPNLVTKTTVIERFVTRPYGSFIMPINEGVESQTHRQYVRKPILTRRKFIMAFSDNGGYDPDKVTEFICDLESIDGLFVEIAPTELTIRFSPSDNSSIALFTFGISNGHADFYIMPGRIKSALERHGFFEFQADPLLEFYKKFVDTKRCKTPPYEYEAGFYYAVFDDVLAHSQDFIAVSEAFANSIEKRIVE